jgi:pre-mRNA-splicing factor 38A
MAQHRADAKVMMDDRGYSGTLIRGQNPALLMEKAVRDRITTSQYWLERCFGLNEATLCDRAVELTFISGTYGSQQKPSPFLCLAFKLLQLTPPREIVLELLLQKDFKYLTALAAFYVRLTFEAVEVYKTLEPLLADYRKLRRRTREGFRADFVDQFVDDLLTKERVCGTSLWKLPARQQLEDLDMLEARVSALGDEIDEIDADDLGEGEGANGQGSEEGEEEESEEESEESGEDVEGDESRNGKSRSPS